MPEETSLEEYEQRLAKMVKKGLVVCPECENNEEFLVNEIGHVFCERCYTKIPMLRLNQET